MRRRVTQLILVMVAALLLASGVAIAATVACQSGSTSTNPCKGTNSDDTINGTSGKDYIESRWGDDTIDGKEGDDTIDGGYNRDTITGGSGTDTIYGGYNRDTIKAVDGVKDYIYCGPDEDTVTADSIDYTAPSCENVNS